MEKIERNKKRKEKKKKATYASLLQASAMHILSDRCKH